MHEGYVFNEFRCGLGLLNIDWLGYVDGECIKSSSLSSMRINIKEEKHIFKLSIFILC